MKRWTHPIHTIIHNVFKLRMPGLVDGQQMSVIYYIQNAVTVLESSEGIQIAVTHSHYQIACPFGCLQAMD